MAKSFVNKTINLGKGQSASRSGKHSMSVGKKPMVKITAPVKTGINTSHAMMYSGRGQ